jgi:hypothetical protein
MWPYPSKTWGVGGLVRIRGEISWLNVSQPHFGQSGRMQLPLPKVETWSPPGLPKIQKAIWRVKSPRLWRVLYINGKLLKRTCPKWPRIAHLDICSPSYGQKKGRESNWQFDSGPLKVWNLPLPDVSSKIATWRWKDFDENYNFGLGLVLIWVWGEEIWPSKVPGLQPGTVSGLQLGSLGKKRSFGCSLGGELQRILYRGRWWLPPSPGRGESSSPKCPWLVPTPKGVPECELTLSWLVLDANSCLIF